MKLVTFGYGGRVGYLDGEEIVVLDTPSMRELFEDGGADETGERIALEDTELRAPIVPKKFFHTAGNFREHEEESKQVGWSHEIAPWIVFFQNVDAIVGPEEPSSIPSTSPRSSTTSSSWPSWCDRRASGSRRRRRSTTSAATSSSTTSPRATSSGARCARRLQLLQGDRHLLSARAVDRHAGRDPQPARPRDGAPRQRRGPADIALEPHERDDPEILSHYSALGYSAGDVVSTGTVSGVAGFSPDAASLYLKPGDVMECEIEKIGVLRNPVISWQEAHHEPAPPRVRW